MLCKKRHISVVVLLFFFVELTYSQTAEKKGKITKQEKQTVQQQGDLLLKRNLTLQVYASETLESVIFRLENLTAEHFSFQPNLFSSYKAKAASYQNTPFRSILDEQLQDTPIRYFFNKTQLAFEIKTEK